MFKQCILIASLCVSPWCLASTVNCSGFASVGGDYVVPHTGVMMTAPDSGGGYIELYSSKGGTIGGQHQFTETCTGALFNVGFTVTDIPAGTIHNYNNYVIYPTSVKGIGVSIQSGGMNQNLIYKDWPQVSFLAGYATYVNGSVNLDNWTNIIIWKTPEFTGQLGDISFTGPTFMMVAQPSYYPTDKIGTCPTSDGKLNDQTCVYLSRTIKGTVQLKSGTCELQSTSHVVHLGKFSGHSGNYSSWKDASFTIKCPTAWGYGAKVENSKNFYDVNDGTVTGNSIKNKPVMINIHPRSPAVDAPNGVFKVTGGAEGFGIQLAWGHPGEQSSAPIPTKPVHLDNAISAHLLNSDFSNTDMNFGSNALPVGREGLIKMSARYARTTGPVVAGEANGIVEVQASYR